LARLARLAPAKPTAVLHLAEAGWSTLSGDVAGAPAGDVLAVTSVADPASFVRMVGEDVEGHVELMAFPDHHHFDASDAREISRAARGRIIAVTEKDAVKLVAHESLLPPLVRVLRLVARPGAGAERIEGALERIAGQAARWSRTPAGARSGAPA
jgi:tetraacyldisaccharide-1-P 4'-kinase